MPVFGAYETVEEIPSRPWVFVATARLSSETGPPRLVLKTTRSMAGLDTPAEAEQRRLDLLQSAAVQDQVAQHRDSRRWAQIRETSSSASETYIIMDRYDRSAADLSRQRRLTRTELRTLSLAVLEGLEEIGSCCGRGHGRLGATNVLLRSKGDSVLGEIVLCDPAPETPDAVTIDLRDFGFLVRHLATGYEERAGEPPESAWAHLGGAAAFWRDISNELIHLDAEAGAIDLPGLVARIEKGATTERRWKVPAATATLVVLCIGVVGWVIYTQEPRVQLEELHDEWRVLCIEGDGWSNGLWKPLKRQRDLISNRFDKEDPLRVHIELRLDEIDMLLVIYEESIPPDGTGLRHPEQLSSDTSDILLHLEERARPWDFLSPKEFQNGVEAAHAAVMTLKNSMSDRVGDGGERWGLHEELDRLETNIYSQKAWSGIDILIVETVKMVSPESYILETETESQAGRYQSKTVQQLAAAIVDAAELEYRLSKLASMWLEAEKAVRELEKNAGDDPVLGRVGELLETTAMGMPEDHIWDIKAVEDVSMKVEAALGPLRLARDRVADALWSKTETRLLNVAAKKLIESEGIKPGTFEIWASLAKDHGRLDGESPVASLIADLEIERVRLNRIVGDDTNQDEEVRTLRADIHDLNDLLKSRNSAWILKHESEIGGSATELRPRVQDLTDRIGDFEITSDEMLVTLRSASDVLGESALLQAYREQRRLEWITGLESNLLQPYKVNRSFEQLNTSLDTLMNRFPALEVPSVPAAFDEAMIASAVQEERGRTLEKALDIVSADWGVAYAVSDSDTEALRALADGREQWLQDSAALLRDLASASARLLAYEPLEGFDSGEQEPQRLIHKWMTEDIYTELGGDASFGSLARLVADLAGVQSADRSMLAGWVLEHDTKPQLAYAAWRRLGAQDRLWPATAVEIEQAAEYVGAVMLVFASDAELAARAEELRLEAAKRWSDSAEGMVAKEDWAGMEKAFDTMPSFGVDIGKQGGGVRLNAALYSLSKTAASGDDELTRVGLESYRAAVSDVTLISQSVYKEVLQSFEAEAAEGTNVEALTGAGPGGSGWTGELDRAETNGRLGEVLRFRGGGGYAIEFHLIEEQANPPRLVYLSTAEVSIGVAGWALGRDGGRREIEDTWSVLASTQWDGPRTWKLAGNALVAMPAREDWFRWSLLAQSRNDKFASAVQFDESITADQRPIQHISFAAAEMLAGRLGCRLPTKDEWTAALARRTVGGSANLRDASFGLQQAHVKQQVDSQLPYPDDGIFTPTDTPLGPNAVDGQGADSTLFFQAVGGEHGFEHMFGNVAEWVLVDGKPGVIGGSALSHPTQDHQLPHTLSGRNTRGRSFSDVGFRLALQIEGTLKPSIATLIQDWFKEEPRYVTTTE